MKYVYELTLDNGMVILNTQDYKFTEGEMLSACHSCNTHPFNKVMSVKFSKTIPNGYHLCGCGNIAKGTKDELCDECKQLYGHTYEHEL